MAFSKGLLTLLNNVSATGDAFEWGGGRGVFSMPIATGAGTVKLQFSLNNGATWQDVDRSGDTYVTLTATGAGLFELPPCLIRANVSGFTGITAYAGPVNG